MTEDWTETPPTAPGWYWHSKCAWYGRESGGPYAVLVELYAGKLVSWVPFMDYADPVADKDSWPGLWLGPVTPPALRA